MLCYVMLCYAMLGYVMLCRAVPCRAVPCCVSFCFVLFRFVLLFLCFSVLEEFFLMNKMYACNGVEFPVNCLNII